MGFDRIVAPRPHWGCTRVWRSWISIGAACLGLVSMGCQTSPTVVVWEKAGATEAELTAAREACRAEPRLREPEGLNRTRYEADADAKQFVECMEARGFTWRTRKADAPES